MGVGLTTLQRWRREFKAAGNGVDRLKGSCLLAMNLNTLIKAFL